MVPLLSVEEKMAATVEVPLNYMTYSYNDITLVSK